VISIRRRVHSTAPNAGRRCISIIVGLTNHRPGKRNPDALPALVDAACLGSSRSSPIPVLLHLLRTFV